MGMIMGLIYALIILTVAALMVIAASMRVSSIESRKEEAENPCCTCLRWEECNGVDAESCPVIASTKGD